MMHLEPDGSAGPDIWTIFPIARIHSCFSEKFGIPRQPGLAAKATARMEMLPPYDRSEMVRGLEKFSHIWIHFLFHDAITEGWRPTVRPPWLGGRKRVGVFASRSPHRPNFIGLSVVRLLEIHLEGKRLFLELAGVDFLDQTPVFDIKPYLPYSDRIIEATGGYAVEPKGAAAEVEFSDEALAFCLAYRQEKGRDLSGLIREILQQDPRPASQKEDGRNFGMLLWDINVRWQVSGRGFLVLTCESVRVR
jgi:tRNA-Thr(GGU) m(6)t(6)A37 methyltransferase TsaA